MKRSWWQPTQSRGDIFSGYRTRCREGATRKPLRQKRRTCDRSRASTAEEAGLDDSAIFDADGQLQNVAANRIRRLHLSGRVCQLAGVARIPEVLENQFAEHPAIVA